MNDPVLRHYPVIPFGDLSFCFTKGLLYQTDMKASIEYGPSYFDTYVKRENSDIAKKLNAHRCSMVEKRCKRVLDIGVGSGEFLKTLDIDGCGYDINPCGVKWLEERKAFVDPYRGIPQDVDGITLWDTLEHMEEPSVFLQMVERQFVFVSLPIFQNLFKVRQSKHYKRGEHLLYFSVAGLTNLFYDNGFELLEVSDGETTAGREDILSFVFRRYE